MMHVIQVVLQLFVALGLLNVWLLRYNQPTPYRGGNAKTMREEFAAYGLPPAAMYVVGGLKVAAALCLIVGIWLPVLVFPAALVVALLMVGALMMHVRIHDALMKSVPAVSLLVLCAVICILAHKTLPAA